MASTRSPVSATAVAVACAAAISLTARANAQDGQGPVLVRYTEARIHTLRRSVRLPGTIESAIVSTVASEVEGLVMEMSGREGAVVSKGDVLAKLRTTNAELQLKASEAALHEAEARRQLAERELVRARDLFDRDLFTEQQLDATRFELDAREGRVRQLQAEIARLQDDIERSTIRAPFGGVVVGERTQVGEWVDVGGPVVEMQTSRLRVAVDVPERYFDTLRLGATATVQFEARPGLELEGRLDVIVPRASDRARNFPVKVAVEHQGERIGAGMLAEVVFPIGTPYEATIVPKDAVILRGAQRFVYRLTDKQTAEVVSVQTGDAAGAWVAVEGEIRPGAKVITHGNERLAPGQSVRPEPMHYDPP